MTTQLLTVVREDRSITVARPQPERVVVVRSGRPVVQVVSTATGITGPAGPPGLQGPQGPPGPPGDGGYRWDSPATPATVWLINHNLGRRPSVQAFTTGGVAVGAVFHHINDNQVRIEFNAAQAGYALLT